MASGGDSDCITVLGVAGQDIDHLRGKEGVILNQVMRLERGQDQWSRVCMVVGKYEHRSWCVLSPTVVVGVPLLIPDAHATRVL